MNSNQRLRLRNQTLVVIGGTTGLGLSAAKAFIAEGARVVVVGRNPDSVARAQTELGDQGLAQCGDAALPATAAAAIELALEHYQGFDGLYHVAGGSGRKMGDGPLHDITDAGWRGTLSLNLDSVFYSNRAAVHEFLKRGRGGSVLNMASVLAYSPSPKFFGTHAYSAAKAAIIGLTKTAAAYYANHNIRFNALAPALVETPMAARARNDDTIQAYIKTKQPLDGGRMGHPQDLDAAAVYFLSKDAAFTTGQVLAVDGGWDVSEGQIP